MAEEVIKEEYGDDNIKVLEGLSPVRKRPGMYIGGTGIDGLHHMIWEVVDNSADEALAGYGDTIEVERKEDHSISVRDYGRGIPVGINKTTGLSTVETVLTVLHAGGKFDANSYKVSGGLHGVGVSVVTALSLYIQAEVCRDKKLHRLRIEDGGTNIVEPLHEVGKCKETGTRISFKPDPAIFKESVEFDDEMIKTRLRRSSFLTPKVKYVYIYPTQEGEKETVEYYSENGLPDYLDFVFNSNSDDENANVKITETFNLEKGGVFDTGTKDAEGNKEEKYVTVKFAFAYGKKHSSNVLPFVNNIPTPDGGPHETAMYRAMQAAISSKAKEKKLDSKLKGFTTEDIKEGLNAIIAVYVYEPQFEGQTKGKLSKNTAVNKAVYAFIKENLEIWLEENPKTLKAIVQKVELAKKARESADRSREAARRSEEDSMVGILPTKLADCRTKNPEEAELYLVEGDSAGGGAKTRRNRETQAILSLKGKVLNVYKSSTAKAMKHTEIGSLVTAIGAGVGKDFDISKARYHKVIILTDADVDGGHIGFLLMLVFWKYFRPMVEAGYIYVSVPPLHRISKGDKSYYFYSDKERLEFFIDLWKSNKKEPIPTTIIHVKNNEGVMEEKEVPDLEALSKGWTSTRFKGLGEMNPEQLEETALKPETRILKQLKVNEVADFVSDKMDEMDLTLGQVLEILGGDDSDFRRWFLMKFTSEIEVDV